MVPGVLFSMACAFEGGNLLSVDVGTASASPEGSVSLLELLEVSSLAALDDAAPKFETLIFEHWCRDTTI
jgi:hypothetical protein